MKTYSEVNQHVCKNKNEAKVENNKNCALSAQPKCLLA